MGDDDLSDDTRDNLEQSLSEIHPILVQVNERIRDLYVNNVNVESGLYAALGGFIGGLLGIAGGPPGMNCVFEV